MAWKKNIIKFVIGSEGASRERRKGKKRTSILSIIIKKEVSFKNEKLLIFL